jgi:hypothetical protein
MTIAKPKTPVNGTEVAVCAKNKGRSKGKGVLLLCM